MSIGTARDYSSTLDLQLVRPTLSANHLERTLAQVLACVVGVESVPVDSQVFDYLGADSIVMARFCPRVRNRGDLPPVSMQDVYRQSTVRALAVSLPLELPAGTSEQPSQPVVDEHTHGPRSGGTWDRACGWVQDMPHTEHVAEMAAKE